jgi:adenylate kinase
MRLVFLGPPGVGKGTQAETLSKEYRVPHIATGDMLRTAMAKRTPVGLEAKSYIDAGKLVPDDVIINLVAERLKEPDTAAGYILDGFPRTIKQAEALSEILRRDRQGIDRVLYFDLNEEELVKRIAGRRSCPACQKVYHMSFNPPPQEGTCSCGTALVQRKDDRPETVKARLVVYRNETAPLIQHYREQGLLSQIDADAGVEAVTGRVKEAIFGKKSS